jgi:hypothetical protein
VTPHFSFLRRALVSVALPAVVLLGGCAGKAPATTSPSGASSSGTAASSSAAAKKIVVTITHGKASGDTGRIPVKLNSPVTIQVTSDTADEVHLHGYDIEKELVPGKPTTISFVANQSGIFEVELHKANVVILHIQVQ